MYMRHSRDEVSQYNDSIEGGHGSQSYVSSSTRYAAIHAILPFRKSI